VRSAAEEANLELEAALQQAMERIQDLEEELRRVSPRPR
jgi:hypothetical protein